MAEKLPLAPLKRIVKSSGIDRVSEKAVENLAAIVVEYTKKIASKAATIAKHAGRKTITEEDINIAAKG